MQKNKIFQFCYTSQFNTLSTRIPQFFLFLKHPFLKHIAFNILQNSETKGWNTIECFLVSNDEAEKLTQSFYGC